MANVEQFLVAVFFFCALLWLGRRIARNPEREPGSFSIRTNFRFLPQTRWARRLLRGYGIALIFISALIPWGVIFTTLPSAYGYVRAASILVLTSIATYFLTPKQQLCSIPDGPSEWIASRRSNTQMQIARAKFEARRQRNEELKLPSSHPRRRLRREKERRMSSLGVKVHKD